MRDFFTVAITTHDKTLFTPAIHFVLFVLCSTIHLFTLHYPSCTVCTMLYTIHLVLYAGSEVEPWSLTSTKAMVTWINSVYSSMIVVRLTWSMNNGPGIGWFRHGSHDGAGMPRSMAVSQRRVPEGRRDDGTVHRRPSCSPSCPP